jgi:hypothetical protein
VDSFKFSRSSRISYCAAQPMAACAALFMESRMKSPDPTKPQQEFRGVGTQDPWAV